MQNPIFGLFVVALLSGCVETVPPPTSAPPSGVTPQVPASIALPAEDPTPAVELPPVPAEPKADDPSVVAALEAEMIEQAALGDKAFQAGVAIDGYTSAGTAFNELNIPEHSCYVLGRLLGKADVVESLKVEYDLDFETKTEENASDLRIWSVSMANFVSVTRHILSLSHEKRVVTWNLDCAGKLGLPLDYIKQEGQSSFYTVSEDGELLTVLGDIEAGFAQKIIDAIEANPGMEVVALGSGGGSVSEAIEAGRYIRRKGLDTTLFNNCLSACPLVFMGGVNRQNWSPYSQLGFHQVYTPDGVAVPADSPAYRMIFSYLVSMGIEPRYVLEQMWSSPPEGMTNIEGDSEDLCRANITTWIQRRCSGSHYGHPDPSTP